MLLLAHRAQNSFNSSEYDTLNYWSSGAGSMPGKALATTRQIRLRICFTYVALYCHGCH